jgi:hypothetical protein
VDGGEAFELDSDLLGLSRGGEGCWTGYRVRSNSRAFGWGDGEVAKAVRGRSTAGRVGEGEERGAGCEADM